MEVKGVKRKLVDLDHVDNHTPRKKSKVHKPVDSTKKLSAKSSYTDVETMQETSKYRTLTDLPAELIYEIVEDFRPRDLVNLSGVSIWVWRTLCNKSTVSIWKKSRENEGVYTIPRGMNEYYWAKLLLGTCCMDCGKDEVTGPEAVDFYIRRRLCKPCRKAKYIEHGPPHDKKFGPGLKLCMFTRVNWDGTQDPRKAYSWKDDVMEQKKKVTEIRKNKRVKQELAEYTASRKELVKQIQAEADKLQKLHAECFEDLKAEMGDKLVLRYREVVKRFEDLGYQTRDFPSRFKTHKLVRQKANLTEKAWQKIRDTFEPQIQAIQSDRELQESVTSKVARRRMVDELYAQYKFDHVPPTEWKYMPAVYNICSLPQFAALVNAEPDRTITLADLSVLMMGLGQSLASTYEETRTRLRQRVPSVNDPFFSELTHTPQFRNLELACIVFRCSICKTLAFGWDDIRPHCCHSAHERLGLTVERHWQTQRVHDGLENWDEEFPYTFEYWEIGSVALRNILNSLGIDPKTTTTAQLDADTYLRLECGCVGTGSAYRHCAYQWRMLVWHVAQRASWFHGNCNTEPKIRVPDEYLPQIIKEEHDKNLRDNRFACVHCPAHLRGGKLIRHWQIIQHLKEEHDGDDPQIDVDYVRLPNCVHTDYHHFRDGNCFDYKKHS